MLFLCLALCALAVFLVGRASAQGAEPLPLDVLLLIDHSNSMWDKDGVGSDPDLLRVQAANLFVAYLGVDTARIGNRLGVIHFGGESVLVAPLTLLDSTGRRQAIRAAIANPHRLDWTDPLEALQLAYETLFPEPEDQRDPARQPVVILLTDGKPELCPAPSPEERAAYVADLRALVDRFREQGCPIFTIALSNEATDADPEIQTVYRNLWQEIAARTPPAEYHEARTADDLLRIYHAIVARLTGAEPDAPVIETSVDGRAVETVTVETGLAQVTLVVLRSDPALEVRLLRPGGAPARPDDADVRHTGKPGVTREEVWAITNPRPGRWSLELQGYGTVLVWDDGWQRRDLLRHLGTDTLLAGLAVARPVLGKTLPGLRRLARRKGVIWGAAGLAGVGTLAATWLLLQRLAPRPHGALQGGALSPLLANIYLHRFDQAMTGTGQNLVRFADDFVVCCPTREAAGQAGELAARELADLRLRLNPAKTRAVSFEQGFRFLGHRFGGRRKPDRFRKTYQVWRQRKGER